MQTWDRVTLLAAHLSGMDADKIGPKTVLGKGGLDLDSLDKVWLAMTVEEEFDIDLPDEEIDDPKLGTIGGLVEHIQNKLDARPPVLVLTGRVPMPARP